MLRIPILSLGLLLAGAPIAFAGEGALEINQTIATAGGLNGSLVDDPAGFPVRITRPGSYRLTGNLTVDQNTTAILVAASDVTLDLAGFTIEGPNVCTWAAGSPPSVTCTYSAGGNGIESTSAHVVVVNGKIRGMGGSGIVLSGSGGRIEGVDVHHCGGAGITSVAVVRGVSVEENGSVGLSAVAVHGASIQRNGSHGWGGGSIENSVILGNVGNGVSSVQSSISGCVISGNGGHGVLASRGTIVGNQIHDNRLCGIQLVNSGSAADNTVTTNNTSGTCAGIGGQTQISGNAVASSCNTITCTAGGGLGTFCPGRVVSCF